MPRTPVRPALFAAALGFTALTTPLPAQQFQWQSYTTLTRVRDVTLDAAGRYWTATEGGAFSVNPATDSITAYHNVNALSTITLTAVASDPATGLVAFGGGGGQIDILTPDGRWSHALDITRNETRHTINRLAFVDSLLYIAADYGLSSFDARTTAFIATGTHLGAVPPESRALCVAAFGPWLLVGTERGLSYTSRTAANIADSAFWTTMPQAQFPSSMITGLAATGTYAYVGTARGLRAWDGTNIVTLTGPGGTMTDSVVALVAAGDSVYAATNTDAYLIVGLNATPLSVSHSSPITAIAYDRTHGALLVGTRDAGLLAVRADGNRSYIPNSPVGNVFTNIAVDPQGVLWCATAFRGGSGTGISRFDGRAWTNFSTTTTPALPSNDVWSIAVDSSGSVWGGTFGAGCVRLQSHDGAYVVTHYTRVNSPYSGIGGSPDYILVGGITVDHANTVWTVPYDNVTGTVQPHVVAFSNALQSFVPCVDPALDYRANFDITIDASGTKWLAPIMSYRLDPVSPVGLTWFNEGASLTDPSGYRWGTVGPALGLRTNFITTVVVDQYGELWAGTTQGVDIVTNPDVVLSNPAGVQVIKPRLSLLNSDKMNVTAILVDPLNNKWIGTTSNGVFVVNPDGTALLAHFDAETSPLLADEITTIGMNRLNGTIYIGTKIGLSAVTSAGLQASIVGQMHIGPQPYFVPSATPLEIYGAGPNAEIKIFTLSGTLVRDYQAGDLANLGGRSGWDGRDKFGSVVASGVYLIVAGQPDGTAQTVKCAVVRR